MNPLPITLALILGMMPLVAAAQVVNGTYSVTESWSVTLSYSDWADTGYTGVQRFSGSQKGTIVIRNGEYTLIDRTGVQWEAPGQTLGDRTIRFNGSYYHISGSYAFAPGFAAKAYGMLFLGCFAVKVPLVDGEVPAFFDYDYYSADGDLDSLDGGGYMRGSSLTATVSSTLTLTPVSAPGPVKPSVTSDPKGLTVPVGGKATFTVKASGTGPLAYQWWKGNAPVTGATSATLTFNSVTTNHAGNYFAVVSNSAGSDTSQAAALTVTQPGGGGGTTVAPTITKQPMGKSVKEGKKLKLSVKAAATPAPTYQWFFNHELLPNANQSSLELASVGPEDVGAYYVVVASAGKSVTSDPATVALLPPK